MTKAVLFTAGTVVFVFSAAAQTKISGTVDCAKPDVAQAVQVGDHAGHMMMLTQNKCTWSKPIEMEGVQSKDDVGSGIADVHGSKSNDQGYDVTTMANGDKVFVRNQGTSMMKGEMLDSGSGKWNFTGGTGKFKGLKGSGTYKLSGKSDGSATIEIEGEYTLAAASAKK